MTKRHPFKMYFALRWTMMLAWGVIVLLLTTLPGSIPPVNVLSGLLGGTALTGLIGHLGLFALLTGLIWLALCQWFTTRQALMLAVMAALLLGTTTELFQWFIADRDSSLNDLLANWLGVFMSGFMVSVARLR
jgi:VanZ family protein